MCNISAKINHSDYCFYFHLVFLICLSLPCPPAILRETLAALTVLVRGWGGEIYFFSTWFHLEFFTTSEFLRFTKF